MSQQDNLGSFIKENKTLLLDYLETRIEIYRLQGIKASSKAFGYLIWILVFTFLLFLLVIFLGLVLGFWLSELSGSLITGFGITSLVLLVLVVILYVYRKSLFVNPVIRAMLQKVHEEINPDEPEESDY